MGVKQVKGSDPAAASTRLLGDIRKMIEETRAAIAATVNTGLTVLYWRVGARINEEILKKTRADYGKRILATLSQELTRDHGDGFSYSALTRMVNFAECFPDSKIVATLSRQLSWSHFRELLPLDKPLQRDFYAEMCRVERWSVRTLRDKIGSMLYERTALSKKPEDLALLELQQLRDEDTFSPDLVFRDPYLLDFLGLKGAFREKDLEAAILRELEAFIMELGAGFTFVARQKRIMVDHDDYYLDLLFFHRDLRRLVAVELKLDKFRPGHKGQMELYLRWLDKYERKQNENAPLGIILCAGKNAEQIELLELGRSGIHIAEYLTVLPPKDILKRKLHEAIARSRMAAENYIEDVGGKSETAAQTTVEGNLTVRREANDSKKLTAPKKGAAKKKSRE
jgi:predicted nuclease of restriction endonuclease-like (RecB) superfamily